MLARNFWRGGACARKYTDRFREDFGSFWCERAKLFLEVNELLAEWCHITCSALYWGERIKWSWCYGNRIEFLTLTCIKFWIKSNSFWKVYALSKGQFRCALEKKKWLKYVLNVRRSSTVHLKIHNKRQ